MLAGRLIRIGRSVARRTYPPSIFSSRPFHSALKRQLKAEKKAKEKETKLAQAAAQQKTTVRGYHVLLT